MRRRGAADLTSSGGADRRCLARIESEGQYDQIERLGIEVLLGLRGEAVMAAESFSRTLATTSDAGTCWAVLTDVSRVAGWVTVVGEVNEIEPLAKYSTVLMDKVGPFKLKADLDIKVPEVEAPHRIRITAAGEDRQVASRIAIDATLEIKDAGPGGAEVDVSGSYSVTGRVASMASSQVKRKADKILEEFFTQAGQELGTAS